MNLADAGTGDAHDGGNLAHGQPLLVVEGEHHLLVVAQGTDGVCQRVEHILLLQTLLRGDIGLVSAQAQRDLVGDQLLPGHHGLDRVLLHPAPVELHADTQPVGHLLIAGVTPQFAPQVLNGLTHLLAALVGKPGNPVVLARQVDNHPPDALGDIVGKAAPLRVVLVHGVRQHQKPLVDHVVQFHEAGIYPPGLGRDTFDEVRVPQDDLPLDLVGVVAGVALEQLLHRQAR